MQTALRACRLPRVPIWEQTELRATRGPLAYPVYERTMWEALFDVLSPFHLLDKPTHVPEMVDKRVAVLNRFFAEELGQMAQGMV